MRYIPRFVPNFAWDVNIQDPLRRTENSSGTVLPYLSEDCWVAHMAGSQFFRIGTEEMMHRHVSS
jgi:hypothetical protein